MTISRRTVRRIMWGGLALIVIVVVLGAMWMMLNLSNSPEIGELPTRVVVSGRNLPTSTPQPRFTVDISDDPITGDEDSAVTVVIFSDFVCNFCTYFGRTTWQSLREQYEDRVKFVYRDFPITSAMSMSAALAAECADDQGQFWAYHDRLFALQMELTTELLYDIANELELDEARFTDCLQLETHRDEILADYADAQSLGLTGAPVFFINGIRLEGAQPLRTLSEVIDAELAPVDP